VWGSLIATFLVFVGILFGAAGTIRWAAGWAYLILFFSASLYITISLARHDPALLAERMKPPIQKGQPLWDRIFLLTSVAWCGWFLLMGLGIRFSWSAIPAWLFWIGGASVAIAFWIIQRTFRENTFLAPVVKIQRERGHQVVSTGPYAVVRHPLYAAAIILLPATALILGSWYGLAASLVLVVGVAYRTVMEERELRQGLKGYTDYAALVRYRLVPFIW
jgi:protein-S-isoprenylcysteine O-methyltransferase Ste14